MSSGFIQSGSQKLHYLRWGHGPRLLLAFHGYANTAGLFAHLAQKVAAGYTTLSVDLPHHGRSEWAGTDPWTRPELVQFVKAAMAELGVQQVSLAGFSLGGRVCLTLLELMPEAVERVVLIAPDGLVPNYLYWFVTRNPAGRRLFRDFIERPERYIRLVDWLHRRNWLNASKRKFVLQYVSAPQARDFLKRVWPGMRLLIPDRGKVKQLIRQFRIPTYIFMGRYDRIIPPRYALTFAKGNPEIQVQVLDKGHRLMDEESLQEIARTLMQH